MSNLQSNSLREQLLREGFCVFPQQLAPELIAQLRAVTDELLESESGARSARSSLAGQYADHRYAPGFRRSDRQERTLRQPKFTPQN